MAPRPERLKDPWQDVVRDRTAVVDLDSHLLVVTRQTDTDRRPRRAVLNGIGREVRERLDDAMFVPCAGTIGVAFKRDLTVRAPSPRARR